jgi:hypothetical protein
MTTATSSLATTRGITAPLLVGGAILLTTGFQLIQSGVGMFVASDHDIHRSEGVQSELISCAVVGAVVLVIAFAIALSTYRSAGKARVAAIVLGALSVLSLPVFWAGGPAIFGSLAAWLGGLTRDSRPQSGAARAFGIVGLVLAILDVVAVVILTIGALVTKGYGA